ncbi:Gfo/Idh/MocA family oxidoreductase [Nakamurella flava]|uniref:Gfo/Idh/MocA family oxidoreductase n=1 Tax=Nakamurella flava TaxID=2576308 RepID=A0A4U6QFX7_9ACTN|nr:Gfo/Idh/MocA family oxidoreductase [Nakamurella flava]TKV59197.1 Gfo/Idh/MocA family oxidoreductase [Nakamurella flava]
MTGFPTALPTSRVPDPRAAPSVRWGVIGTGWIAERFVGALLRNTGQQVVAIGSRDVARSREFAGRFGVSGAYGSYEELVAAPDVDVVYVATPHNAHRPCARLVLEAGKHVLVEKPIGLNAAEAQELADLADERGLFCMEALWSLFLPKFDVIRQLMADGVLGTIGTVLADMGEWFPGSHRILRADLAGGPLLDLGTYPVMFANWILGSDLSVTAIGQPHPAGVNGQVGALLADAAGHQAVVHSTLGGLTPTTATVAGTSASLFLDGPFYQPGTFTLVAADGSARLRYEEEAVAHEALHFQAAEVARCISEGRTQSAIRPLADSIATLRVIDEIRRQLGIVFAEER